MVMIDKTFAAHFANDWIDSWNSHNLSRILSHYTDEFEMSSPIIIQIVGEPSGTLKGKDVIGSYWAKALSLFPDLQFHLIAAFIGINSITLNFRWERGSSAEVFVFGPDLKVTRSYVHHAS